MTNTRHAYGIRRTVPYVVSCHWLTQHNQENARMSPDPFPFCGWGLGTRLAKWRCNGGKEVGGAYRGERLSIQQPTGRGQVGVA